MSASGSIVTLTGSNGTFTATADANGAYSISVPSGTYTMSVSIPNENGFVKTFSRAVVVDIDQPSGSTVMSSPILDVDADASVDAVVDVYFIKSAVVGVQSPVATTGEFTNDRTDTNGNGGWRVVAVLTPNMFGYTTNEVSPVLQKVKITQLPQSGVLFYNGVSVTTDQELSVSSPSLFSGSLTYASNTDNVSVHDDTLLYSIKTVASNSFGTSGTFVVHNSAMSYVSISSYLDYTALQLKGRATIPAQNAMVVSSSDVKCYKIDTRIIGDILGDPLASIATLSNSAEVNQYSQFSPREWWDNSGVIESKVKSVYSQDNFAGYHHDAIAPYVIASNGNIQQGDPNNSSVWAELYIGEIDWATQIGATHIMLDIWAGGIHCGSRVVDISEVSSGAIRIEVPSVEFQFISDQSVTGTVYFMSSVDSVIGLVPDLPEITFSFIAEVISIAFESTDGINDAQLYTVITPNDTWDIASQPSWLTCAVYRGEVYVPSGPYLSGDTIRVYPSSANVGLNRTDYIILTESVTIEVTQSGGVPTASFDVASPLVVSQASATLVVGSNVVPISFKIESGLGSTNAPITFQLYKDGVGFIGIQQSANTRDGQIVSPYLTNFVPGDIENGHTYTVHIDTFL